MFIYRKSYLLIKMGGATLNAAYPILRRLINGSAKLITHSIKGDLCFYHSLVMFMRSF